MSETTVDAGAAFVRAGRAFLERLAADATLTDDGVSAVMSLVAEVARLTDGAKVVVAGQVAARTDDMGVSGLARRSGFPSVSAMLIDAFCMRRSTAARVLQVARLCMPGVRGRDGAILPSDVLPEMGAALVAGDVTLEQAAAFATGLASAAHRAADTEVGAALVAEADRGFVALATDPAAPAPPEMLAQISRAMSARIDPESLEPDHERMVAERRFGISPRDDGMYRVSGLLTPDAAATITAVVDAYASPRRTPSFDPAIDGRIDADDVRSQPQKRADALVEVFANHARSGTAPTIGGAAPTLIVTVARDDLAAHSTDGGPASGVARLQLTGDVVPTSVAAQMVCDAAIQVAVVDADGHILDLGREQRLYSPMQRRVIIERDRTCRAPGCTRPGHWCEIHHVRWWIDGGRTDIDNGIALCRFHHTEVHAGRLTITAAPPGSRVPWVVSRTRARAPRSVARPTRRRRGSTSPPCCTDDAVARRPVGAPAPLAHVGGST